MNKIIVFFAEMETKLKEGLPQECREICVCAVGKMQQVCDQILRSEITMEELQKITKDLEQMQRLCAAATFQCKRKKKEEVKIALHQRLEEFEMFERRREHLHHLCSQLHIGVQGITLITLYPGLPCWDFPNFSPHTIWMWKAWVRGY